MRRTLRPILATILGALLAAPPTLAVETAVAAVLAAPLLALALYEDASTARAVPTATGQAPAMGRPTLRRCQVATQRATQPKPWLQPARVRIVRCGDLGSYV